MRVRPIRSVLTISLASCLVPASTFAQTKTDDVGVPRPSNPPASSPELPWYLPPASQAFVPPRPPAIMTEKTADASMEVSVEPAFFVGANAPPHPGLFLLFRLAGRFVGFDFGVLTNVGLPGDTLGTTPALPESKSQTAGFVFGANFIHYGLELYDRGANHLDLLLPEPDLRFIFSFANVPSSAGTSGGIVVAPGVSLLGLRFSRCIGGFSWVTELRGPTVFAYLPALYGGDTVNPYGSLGFSFATGLAL